MPRCYPHLRCFGLLISTAALRVEPFLASTRRKAVIPLPLRVMRIYVILLLFFPHPRFSLPFNSMDLPYIHLYLGLSRPGQSGQPRGEFTRIASQI
ncbi:hypothetical protein BJV74DRAFT_803392 [Russula compacta]|nr:hypothetical protein BJV74DRAFT_803392 [Russula compacta]